MFYPLCFFIHGSIYNVSLAKYELPNALTSGQFPRVFHVDSLHEVASGEDSIKHICHITQVGYEDTVKNRDRLLKETFATSISEFKTA